MKKKILSTMIAIIMLSASACNTAISDDTAGEETGDTTEMTETTTEETTSETTEETTEATTTETTEETTEETASETTTPQTATGTAAADPNGLSLEYETSDPVITSNLGGILRFDTRRDGLNMSCKMYLPTGEGPFPTVIIGTGIRESCEEYIELAQNFQDNGIACVLFDFCGGPDESRFTSNSEGVMIDMTLSSEVKDMNAVLDAVLTLDQTDKENVFLFGHSFGGEVATVVASQREDDINALILMEPAYQMSDIISVVLLPGIQIPDYVTTPFYLGHDFLEEIIDVDIYAYMGGYDDNVILFQGDTGDSLGLLFPQYYTWAGETFPSMRLEVIQGGDHVFSGDAGRAMFDLCLEFIDENKI